VDTDLPVRGAERERPRRRATIALLVSGLLALTLITGCHEPPQTTTAHGNILGAPPCRYGPNAQGRGAQIPNVIISAAGHRVGTGSLGHPRPSARGCLYFFSVTVPASYAVYHVRVDNVTKLVKRADLAHIVVRAIVDS
jgi:hypothetical protein